MYVILERYGLESVHAYSPISEHDNFEEAFAKYKELRDTASYPEKYVIGHLSKDFLNHVTGGAE